MSPGRTGRARTRSPWHGRSPGSPALAVLWNGSCCRLCPPSIRADLRPGGRAGIGGLGKRAGLHGHSFAGLSTAYAATAGNNGNLPPDVPRGRARRVHPPRGRRALRRGRAAATTPSGSSSARTASPSDSVEGSAGVRPNSSRTSPAHVTGTAPSRMSAFVPAERLLVLSPLVCCAVRADLARQPESRPLRRLDRRVMCGSALCCPRPEGSRSLATSGGLPMLGRRRRQQAQAREQDAPQPLLWRKRLQWRRRLQLRQPHPSNRRTWPS